MTSNINSAESIKLNNIEKMGENLGAIYSELWQEIVRLHSIWDEYVVLFGTNQKRTDLLNEAAPVFFRTVQDAFWEKILLKLAKLTDPIRTAGKDNLTIKRIPSEIKDPQFKKTISSLVESAVECCKFARDWRNRKIAHNDLDWYLGQAVDELAFASRQSVIDAISAFERILNAISNHYLDSTTMFKQVNIRAGYDLLCLIQDGLKYQDERSKKIEAGNFEGFRSNSYDF